MESSNPDTAPKSATVIANYLTLQLSGIALVAVIITGISLLPGFGPITIVLLVLGNVAVLWMIVAAVIAALDDLLELKLRQLT